MNKNKYSSLSILFAALIVLLSGQAIAQNSFVFKVLGVSGTIKKHTASGDVALSPGAKLNSDESIIIENGYCGLLHSTGKGLEVKKPGTYQVADLAKSINTSAKAGKVSDRYVNYVMGQLTKEEAEDINANHRKYMEVTGSVERGSTVYSIRMLALKSNEVLPKTYTLTWNSNVNNVEYLLEVHNLFNENIFTAKTKENSAAVDFAPLFAKHGKNLLVSVKVVGKPEIKSNEYSFKLASGTSAADLGLSEEKTPVSNMVNGMICEENNLYMDALAYYKEATSQEASVEGYKEAYLNLYKRITTGK
ncbi:MAG TPA: hypothetical protein PK509_03230 [Catalimonadaceae bacterium]|nr:hypothetical protein [Catalimonadaceae bacterium]HPI11597.1 hypothetical protein [Catalimonadaceae bacterium]